VCFS
jgi:hypothetical protein